MSTTTLPIDMDETRRWDVRQHSGELFFGREDYDGLAVTIELRSPEEAKVVAQALLDHQHEEL